MGLLAAEDTFWQEKVLDFVRQLLSWLVVNNLLQRLILSLIYFHYKIVSILISSKRWISWVFSMQ